MLIIARLIRLSMLMFGICSATFFIVHYGLESDCASTAIIKYVDFLKRVMHMDFGVSTVTGQSVLSEIMTRWPATIELGVIAMLMSIVIGIPLGMIAASNHKKKLDRFLMSFSLFGYSMPTFWFALILILLFSVEIGLTPVSGRIDIMYDITPVTGFMMVDTLLKPAISKYQFKAFFSALSHLILPSIVLASMPTAAFARMTRSSMLDILSKDFILNARAKGLSKYRVILIHGLRNALTPIFTVGGVHFITTVIMGSIVIEIIFGWPGIGNYIMQSVYARDYSVLQFFLLSLGIIVLIMNTLIDLVAYLLSPRKII